MNPTTKRTRPLVVGDAPAQLPAPPPIEANGTEARAERFADDVRALKVGRGSVVLGERILLVLGGVLAPLGIAVVVLGWYGASHTSYDFEQIPYLISGGLLGLALVFVGCFFYFAHWLTRLVQEHREQSTAILAALNRLIELEEQDS